MWSLLQLFCTFLVFLHNLSSLQYFLPKGTSSYLSVLWGSCHRVHSVKWWVCRAGWHLIDLLQNGERDSTAEHACHRLVCPVWLVVTPLTFRHQTIWPSRILFNLLSSCQKNAHYINFLTVTRQMSDRNQRKCPVQCLSLQWQVVFCLCLNIAKFFIKTNEKLSVSSYKN